VQVKAGAFYGRFNSGLVEGLGASDWPWIRMRTVFDEMVCLPLMGGNNLESILFTSPVADL
jgi:hypothetical protein